MEKTKYQLNIALLLLLISMVTACKKDPSPQENQLIALKNNGNPWVLDDRGVEKDGYDVTDQFIGFKLNFGDYTYTTQNSLASAWPGSGTWEFDGDNLNSLVRDDGVVIKLVLNESTLTLNFTVAGLSGGRITSLTGEYNFNLKAN